MKKALITGITGQDGSYMAELLLSKGYEVHGLVRRTSIPHLHFLKGLKLTLHEGDLADFSSLSRIIKEVQPDEVYNFGAMAGVSPSFKQPIYTIESCGTTVANVLEAVRQNCPTAKVFQASSSHIFGDTKVSPQNEDTPTQPISPYGCGKALGHNLCRHYRNSYGMFIVSGILYAHASPRYSEQFLLGKISKFIKEVKENPDLVLEVGDIDNPMDISYAKDIVEAIYEAMQLPEGHDFVLGSGEAHTPREVIDLVFNELGLDKEKNLKYNSALKRPSEVSPLIADYSKANKMFGYKPKTSFYELIKLMCYA